MLTRCDISADLGLSGILAASHVSINHNLRLPHPPAPYKCQMPINQPTDRHGITPRQFSWIIHHIKVFQFSDRFWIPSLTIPGKNGCPRNQTPGSMTFVRTLTDYTIAPDSSHYSFFSCSLLFFSFSLIFSLIFLTFLLFSSFFLSLSVSPRHQETLSNSMCPNFNTF